MLTSSRDLESVRALVFQVVAQHGGTVTSYDAYNTYATFRKRFSWALFVLLLGVFYLLYWAVTDKTESLAVSHMPQGGGVVVGVTPKGRRAVKAGRAIIKGV